MTTNQENLKDLLQDGFTLQKKSKKTMTKATDAQENLSSLLKADSKSKKSVEVATKHPNKLGAGASERKKLKKPEDKVAAVMKEFKNGTLHSGSGEIVTDVKQAKAIAMSEAGLSKAQVDLQFELLKVKPVESKETSKEKKMTKAQDKLKSLLKGKKYNVGDISQKTGLRKIAPGKWVPVAGGAKGKSSGSKEKTETKGITKLSSDDKKIALHQRDNLGYSYDQIAQGFNISVANLKQSLGSKKDRKPVENKDTKKLKELGLTEKDAQDSALEFLKDNGWSVDDIEDIREGDFGEGYTIEVNGEEYLMVTEQEARNAAEEDLRNFIDDVGVTGFTDGFWQQHIDKEKLGRDLSYDSYVDRDLGYEEPDRYLDEEPEGEDGDWSDDQRERAGDKAEEEYNERVTDDPIGYLEEIYGDINEFQNLSSYVDEDSLIDEAISVDGIAHFLARYDGNEQEAGNRFFYRTN